MELSFYKMHAAGNDFVFIERPEGETPAWDRLSPLLCDRKVGIGAAGLIVVSRGANDTLRLFAPDGSELRPCGDAIACATRFFADSGRISKTATFLTKSGELEVDVVDSRYVGMKVGFVVDRSGERDGAETLVARAVPVKDGARSGIAIEARVAGFPAATVLVGVGRSALGENAPRRCVAIRPRGDYELRCAAKRDARFDGCSVAALAASVASAHGLCRDNPAIVFSKGTYFARIREGEAAYVAACADYSFSGEVHVDPQGSSEDPMAKP
jgi:hypothetical protein